MLIVILALVCFLGNVLLGTMRIIRLKVVSLSALAHLLLPTPQVRQLLILILSAKSLAKVPILLTMLLGYVPNNVLPIIHILMCLVRVHV
jgi:hypothetical protein